MIWSVGKPERMNKNLHKLIFCRVRRMVVAVAEFATSHATEPGSGTGVGSLPVLRAVACAAMVLLGTASTLTLAQIVPSAGSGAQVLQTQNGLQQVNIAKPSAAGVSLNNFAQFDVPGKGAILNNSPTIVQTQQAGYVNGNPNLAPGQSAGIIVTS
ncbi:filamentous hemagglutinin domain protein, partial [Burkholderia sp. MR1]